MIHLNGPPGIGKSALARRYVDDHPLTLLVEVDALRLTLGRWNEHDDSKSLARDLALAMADCHLWSGHDVVVPQFLGREEFIVSLRAVARRCDAQFVEILVEDTHSVAGRRFRSRRQELLTRGESHPQADVGDDEMEAAVHDAIERLTAIVQQRPSVVRIADAGTVEATYVCVRAAVDAARP